MNKKLLTLAIGAALASAPMFANAALTAYGKLNVGIAMIDNGNPGTAAQDSSEIVVTDDASRLGFKGEEDLGGGLKGLYLFEMTIDVDNGGFGSARDTFVGLGSNFGTLRIGQYNTAYKGVSIPTEIFGDTIADFTANGFSGETRQANNIGYTSPKFGGFSFGLEYATSGTLSTQETGATASQQNPINAAVTWAGGPIYVAAGYYDYDLLALNGLASAMKLSAMGTFGGFKVAATYEDQSGDGNFVVTDTANLAGMFTLGNHQFALSYSMYMADSTLTTDQDCSMIGAGYFYNFSKTNAVKVVYNQIDNGVAASCMGRMTGAVQSHALPNTANGNTASGFQVMMSSSF
jgi:predicted porin